jgi:ABC-type multidrug transport system ATPase subunit
MSGDENTGGSLILGYLPESPALYGYMNGYEYLDFIGACCNYTGGIKARTAEVLEITGMTDSAGRLIKGYSRGMNQRIGIAAALYAKPDLLILDEPTSALDPEGRAEVMNIITKLRDTGATIILCTHILSDVERIANKVGIMRNGVIAVEGNIKDVTERLGGKSVIGVQLREYDTESVTSVCSFDLLEKSEIYKTEGIMLHPKEGLSEAEFFFKVTQYLAEKNIVPESVAFRRMTLEQIYIGVTNGSLGGAV